MTNGYTWRSREDLNIDTRTATEYGVVRTFFDATFTWTTDSYTQSGTVPGSTVYSQLGATGVGAPATTRPRVHVLRHSSASTMRSSSSLASRSVKRSRRSTLPARAIQATTSTVCRRRRHDHWCEPVHLHRTVRRRLCRALVGAGSGCVLSGWRAITSAPVAPLAPATTPTRLLPNWSLRCRSIRLGARQVLGGCA